MRNRQYIITFTGGSMDGKTVTQDFCGRCFCSSVREDWKGGFFRERYNYTSLYKVPDKDVVKLTAEYAGRTKE